jgi:Calpain family cysteine protease
MTTNIDPTRLRPRNYADDSSGAASTGAAPNPDDRAVRRAADERLTALVSDQSDHGPCDAIPNPVLFRAQSGDANDINLHDVRQRGFGDCFFLAPLAALTQSPEGRDLIRSAIAENRNDRGEVLSYTVTLHVPQRSMLGVAAAPVVKVAIDPSFECGHASPRVENGSAEVWSMVMEAALAKLGGGYPAIKNGGLAAAAMEILTGRPATREAFTWFSANYDASKLKADLAAGKMVVFDTRKEVTVDCVAPPDVQAKMLLPGAYGLYPHHSYLAIGTETRDGKEYLLLHNPWDKKEPDPVPFDELRSWFATVNVGSVK